MNKVKAFIEKTVDSSYSVYIDLEDDTLNYGIIGEGDTVEMAKKDFKQSYIAMKTLHKKEGKEFQEAIFKFLYN